MILQFPPDQKLSFNNALLVDLNQKISGGEVDPYFEIDLNQKITGGEDDLIVKLM
jgi:hypothetical protein